MDAFFHEKAEAVENAARKIGLYVQDMGLAHAPRHGGPVDEELGDNPVMVGLFTIGDVAFSDRVLNPETDSIDKEFRQMTVVAEKEQFDDLRDSLEKRLKEGKGIFDEEE